MPWGMCSSTHTAQSWADNANDTSRIPCCIKPMRRVCQATLITFAAAYLHFQWHWRSLQLVSQSIYCSTLQLFPRLPLWFGPLSVCSPSLPSTCAQKLCKNWKFWFIICKLLHYLWRAALSPPVSPFASPSPLNCLLKCINIFYSILKLCLFAACQLCDRRRNQIKSILAPWIVAPWRQRGHAPLLR